MKNFKEHWNHDMTWLWIGGWGVPPEWLERQATTAFPGTAHQVVPPDPEGDWRGQRDSFDRLIGYSLGAFLLLQAEQESPSGRPLALLAPFFAFAAEAGLGGRVPLTRLRFLERWFRRDPEEALIDFYRRAGLTELGDGGPVPYPRDILAAGLTALREGRVEPRVPNGSVVLAGENDPLLDTPRLRELCRQTRGIPGAGHHPIPLISALAGVWSEGNDDPTEEPSS